jgi:hypothetical protein
LDLDESLTTITDLDTSRKLVTWDYDAVDYDQNYVVLYRNAYQDWKQSPNFLAVKIYSVCLETTFEPTALVDMAATV